MLLHICLVLFYFERGVGSHEVNIDMTVNVDVGVEECFYQSVKLGLYITLDYQVVEGGSANEMQIDFSLTKPSGIVVISEFGNSNEEHRHLIDEEGDYKFCFGNKRYRNPKLVSFELYSHEFENDDDYDVDHEYGDDDIDDLFMNQVPTDTSNHAQVNDMENSLKHIHAKVFVTSHQLRMLDTIMSRDISIVEHNLQRVHFWSIVNVITIVIVGSFQVGVLKSFFDDKSKFNTSWNKFFRK